MSRNSFKPSINRPAPPDPPPHPGNNSEARGHPGVSIPGRAPYHPLAARNRKGLSRHHPQLIHQKMKGKSHAPKKPFGARDSPQWATPFPGLRPASCRARRSIPRMNAKPNIPKSASSGREAVVPEANGEAKQPLILTGSGIPRRPKKASCPIPATPCFIYFHGRIFRFSLFDRADVRYSNFLIRNWLSRG